MTKQKFGENPSTYSVGCTDTGIDRGVQKHTAFGAYFIGSTTEA